MMGPKLRTALLLGAAAAAAALLSAPPADAQEARDPVMADALFKSAKVLLQQNDWPGACARFEASMKLDPAVSTLLKIARCHEHDGKLALAWNDVNAALQLNAESGQTEARRKELEEYARTLLVALEARMPRVRVRVAGAPKGLTLLCDGRPLPVGALGDALPVDPGSHRITASAPGYLSVQKDVTVTDGQRIDVEIVLPAASPRPERDAPPGAKPGAARRAAGIGVGAAGVAALGAAGVLGILTMNKVSAAGEYCKPDFSSCADARGITLLGEARGMQTAAFVLLGAGAAAAGVGVALFATAPRAGSTVAPSPEISATIGPLGLSVRGAW